MENNEIDKLYKTTLHDREVQPSADSWIRLANKLDENTNVDEKNDGSKRSTFLWAIPLLLGLSALTFYLYNTNYDADLIEDTVVYPINDIQIGEDKNPGQAIKEVRLSENNLQVDKKQIEPSKNKLRADEINNLSYPQKSDDKQAKKERDKKINILPFVEKMENVTRDKKTNKDQVALDKKEESLNVDHTDDLIANVLAIAQEKTDEANPIIANKEAKTKIKINLDAEVNALLAGQLTNVKSGSTMDSNFISADHLLFEAEEGARKTYIQRAFKTINKKTASAVTYISNRNYKKK